MRRYVQAAVLVDFVAALAAAVLTLGFDTDLLLPVEVLPLAAGWVLLVRVCGGHAIGDLGVGSAEFRNLGRAAVLALSVVAVLAFALSLEPPRGLVVVAIPSVMLLDCLGRYGLRRMIHRLRRQGACMRTVVAVGRGGAVLDLVAQLRRDKYCGMEVRAACVPDPSSADDLRAQGVPVLGDLTQVRDVVRLLDADAVAVTSSSETAASYLRRLSWDLEGSGVELLVAPGLMEVAGTRMHMRPFIGLPLLHVEQPEFRGVKRLVKGAMDKLVAGAVLLLLAPVLAMIAVAVRLDSPGPVLFRQTRVGRGGREFTMWKFRTMVVDAETRRAELIEQNQNADGLLFKIANDPRITPVGRLLRRYSLDELPQLLNVLGGQMSLVGPRPPLPAEVALYDDSVRRRLLVRPGLTGLWQVSGRSDLTWDESVRLDLRYVENWSLMLDVLILWKTAFAVVRARGAY